ncbi:hypothetical protein AN618_03180 [Fervidicola ferrireducens]|uniref:Anti-sigma-W factor RsiW n=1 Tax=Fervidicola ferrireducens TaxID=520764 RepID=A0A140LDD7_9FIRM|nr:zf-HC2 domain-containing protein [Fervidicola ferrireducens]KXG78562.1 hypothetical protein AN618_03180 [Fervidicola ferrireducens]
MCYDDGILQAYLDGELDEREKEMVKTHLDTCAKCKKVLDELKDLDEFAKEKLAIDFNPSMEFLKKRYKYFMIRKGAENMIKKYGKAVAAFAGVLLVFSAVLVSPVRDAVADFLGVFRMSRIEAVKITPEDIEKIRQRLNESGVKEIDLEQFGKFKSIGGGFEEVKPEEVESAAEKVDFDFRPFGELDGYKLAFVGVEKPQKLEITPDVEGINRLIMAFGGEKTLPEEMDGKTFVIRTTGTVRQTFVSEEERANFKSFVITQVGAPEIQVPEGVDLNAVREAMLELPLLPENIRQQLSGIENWQATIPIPVDAEHSEVEDITVKGKPALLVKNRWGDNAFNYAILWTDNQTIFALDGSLPLEEMLKIAESLR